MSQIRIAAIQTSPRFGDITGNLQQGIDLLPEDCDLAVLPEPCTTG